MKHAAMPETEKKRANVDFRRLHIPSRLVLSPLHVHACMCDSS